MSAVCTSCAEFNVLDCPHCIECGEPTPNARVAGDEVYAPARFCDRCLPVEKAKRIAVTAPDLACVRCGRMIDDDTPYRLALGAGLVCIDCGRPS